MNKNTVQNMLAVIDELSRFLDQENAAIRRREFDQVRERTIEKNVLANRYESLIETMKKNQFDGTPLSPQDRDALTEASDALNEIVVANAVLLTAQREAAQHVITAFSTAVKEAQAPSATYSQKGRMNGDVTPSKRVAAASFDQSL